MTTQTSTYKYAVLDPRPGEAAQAANDKIFQDAEPIGVLGIEVTVSALAERCGLGNIDPQHSGGDASRAAIEDTLTAALPPEGATLVTVRADLDAVGAMAVMVIRNLQSRQYGQDEWGYLSRLGENNRVRLVAEADRFARGGWPGPRPLPSREHPWPDDSASAESSRPLAAIAAAVADFKVPMVDRVATMERWLLMGEEPEQYRSQVERERLDMINALETGQIKIEAAGEGRMSTVESTHRAGTMLGYMRAPVVVALNPEFRVGGGEPHKKFTICQFQPGYCDLQGVVAELNEREAGWGGSPTIIGSPQGVTSILDLEEVIRAVEHHLTA